jgi:hypothetical protein
VTDGGRTVIFTAQFGGFDPVMPVLQPTPGVDYVVLSDSKLRLPRPWRLKVVRTPHDVESGQLQNRYCKMFATRLLPEYEYSLYLDTHLQASGDFSELLSDFRHSQKCLGLMRHFYSKSSESEVVRSLAGGRITQGDHGLNWEKQRERHLAAGFSDDLGAFWGGYILRWHGCPEVRNFESAWWEELLTGVRRDQAGLPFVVWRTGLNFYEIPGSWMYPPAVTHWDHLPKTRRYRRALRWFESRLPAHPSLRYVLRIMRPVGAVRSTYERMLAGQPISGYQRFGLRLLGLLRCLPSVHPASPRRKMLHIGEAQQ